MRAGPEPNQTGRTGLNANVAAEMARPQALGVDFDPRHHILPQSSGFHGTLGTIPLEWQSPSIRAPAPTIRDGTGDCPQPKERARSR